MRNDLDWPADCRYNWLKVLTDDSLWALSPGELKNRKKNLHFYKVSSLDYLVYVIQGSKFFLELTSPVGQVASNCYLPLSCTHPVLSFVLKPDLSIKSWNLVHVLKRVLLLLFCCGIVNSNRHLPELILTCEQILTSFCGILEWLLELCNYAR